METDYVSIDSLGLTSEQRKAVGFLAEFTKRMVLTAFLGHKTPTRASNLIKEVYRFTDGMMTGCFKSRTKLACKKGCFWCCFLRVKVTPLEVMGIVDYLRSCLKPGEISELRQRLVRTDGITRGMDGNQRVRAKMMCPLLMDGKCMSYPVRPIACRVYHSVNLSDCEASLEKDGGSVTIRRDIYGLSMGIFTGLTEGLRTVGLQTRLLELTTGLRIAMDDSGSRLVKRWLSGEPAFVEAEIANAKEIESFHRALVEELAEALR
jgi:Fe-S-cluster containining protein